MPEFVSGADRLGDGTSRAEPASARRIGDARNLATQMLCVTRAFGEDLGYGNGCDERLRVGVERALEHHARVRELDDLAEYRHRDPMSDLPDDRQIVRNEDIGQVLFILQPQQKIEDLSLYVDVQRGYRLVRDDELCCKRPRSRPAGAVLRRTRVDIAGRN